MDPEKQKIVTENGKREWRIALLMLRKCWKTWAFLKTGIGWESESIIQDHVSTVLRI